MDSQDKIDILIDYNEEMLLADGFDLAIIGVAEICGNTICAYDYNKCLDILVMRDGMTYEDAEEFMEFNVVGSYMGANTPCFIRLFSDEDLM